MTLLVEAREDRSDVSWTSDTGTGRQVGWERNQESAKLWWSGCRRGAFRG